MSIVYTNNPQHVRDLYFGRRVKNLGYDSYYGATKMWVSDE